MLLGQSKQENHTKILYISLADSALAEISFLPVVVYEPIWHQGCKPQCLHVNHGAQKLSSSRGQHHSQRGRRVKAERQSLLSKGSSGGTSIQTLMLCTVNTKLVSCHLLHSPARSQGLRCCLPQKHTKDLSIEAVQHCLICM